MARPPRKDFAGVRHHVMHRGARRSPIFPDEPSCVFFINLIAELPDRFAVKVHAYVLMPDHFHLLLETRRGNLSHVMRRLSGQFVREMNRRQQRSGSLFRGRYRSRAIEDNSYWMHLLAFLHLSPVRARLVSQVDQSRWSSHPAYAGLETTPDWLTTRELLSGYGSRASYRKYIKRVAQGRELGPKGFDATALFSARNSVDVAVPADCPAPIWTLSAEQALGALLSVTGASLRQLQTQQRGQRGNPARRLAIWWLSRATALSQAEVARLLGTSPAVVCRSYGQCERREILSPQVLSWIDALESLSLEEWAGANQ